jgi:NADH-quinone oxidoreductase subunit F
MSTENKDILAETDNIISLTGKDKSAVIPILQSIQSRYNYLPREALKRVCEKSDITPAEITGVASFYSQFRFEPAGRHIVKVCTGTACHVKGAMLVRDAIARYMKLSPGRSTDDQRLFTLENVACLGCCTLAPVVQIDDVTYGHVTPSLSAGVMKDFLSRGAGGTKRKEIRVPGGELQGEIRVGLGSCCVASGSSEIRDAVEDRVSRDRINVNIKQVGCVGMCHQVPLVEIVTHRNGAPDTKLYAKVAPADVKSIIDFHFKPPGLLTRVKNKITRLAEHIQSDDHWEGVERYSIDVREKHVASFLGNQMPIATEHRGVSDPLDIDDYIERGGFRGLKRALSMEPVEIINEVKESGLRGRGGAGFPTGRKWETTAAQPGDQKILICNGDEGDPGAFMDRMLLESYPFRVIEGMTIAAKAIGAKEGIFYIRAEYPLAVRRINQAIEICTAKGFLGDEIGGNGFSFHVKIKEGAGAFVCGEETALLESIEGKRGFPRLRPPFPAVRGLWGKPTLVNNTETFAMVPYIMDNGGRKFATIGTRESTGTKVFALAGKIKRGGLIEVPMGITIREIVEEIGGGIADGKKFKAVQIGGPSGGCIPYYLSEMAVDFGSLLDAGAMMGSGGLVVLDSGDCMVDMARYFLSFTQSESCGKCTFCRVGTRRMLNILDRLCSGKSSASELDELEKLCHQVKKGSLCGLGKTAPNPVLSTLKYFRDEYEAHLEGRCPTGKCKDLIKYYIDDDCIGCTICSQKCPVDAIGFKPHEKHDIDTALCTKCDICREACPAGAVKIR